VRIHSRGNRHNVAYTFTFFCLFVCYIDRVKSRTLYRGFFIIEIMRPLKSTDRPVSTRRFQGQKVRADEMFNEYCFTFSLHE